MRGKRTDTIIIFGFSGSGKSTMANIVGRRMGLRVIHPSSMMRDLFAKRPVNVGRTKYNRGFWEGERGQRLLKGRLKDDEPIDMASDRILLKELKKGRVVMDSWSMPWLFKGGIKICLTAPLRIRAARVARRSRLSISKALSLIRTKDQDTRRMFKRIYGFDIRKDADVFDLVIATDDLTTQGVAERIMDFVRSQGVG